MTTKKANTLSSSIRTIPSVLELHQFMPKLADYTADRGIAPHPEVTFIIHRLKTF